MQFLKTENRRASENNTNTMFQFECLLMLFTLYRNLYIKYESVKLYFIYIHKFDITSAKFEKF